MNTYRWTRRGVVVKNIAVGLAVTVSTGAFLALYALTVFAWWS